jgi:hypothetical protein
MTLSTATLTVVADLLEAELDARKAAGDPIDPDVAAARLEVLLELRRRESLDNAHAALAAAHGVAVGSGMIRVAGPADPGVNMARPDDHGMLP